MADLYIRISNENGETLAAVNIWQDGSDSAIAENIAQGFLMDWEGAEEIDEDEIP